MGIVKKFIAASTSDVDRIRRAVREDAKASGKKIPRSELDREVVRRINGKTKRF